MPRLQVLQIDKEFVYRDIIQVNVAHRKTNENQPIREGQVCIVRVVVDGERRKCFAVLRGYQASSEPQIRMDEYTREEKLGVRDKQFYEFEFKPVSPVGQLRWAWRATEMGYQVASRLAVLGFVMGVLGLLLGIAGLFDWHALQLLWRWLRFLWWLTPCMGLR